jgi:eukaryotic-like serine/threonine-protein kinase
VIQQPSLADRYRLIRKIGSGGMGHVWLAEDTWLKRQVALKQLTRSGDESTDNDLVRRRRRVLHEARALAKVKHPSIVPIHDLFVVKRDPWIVMEYIKGQSFDQIISAGWLDERSIAHIGLRVLDGLTAAHKEGIVHRDVKPANILVASNGAVFLIDFGIARSAGDPALTGMAIVGTVEYLAPELLNGTKAGPAADIWALGVVLFYALEGYSPFRRDKPDTQAVMTAIMLETPTLTRSGPLADITLRMLAKDPGQRAAAAEVRRVLDRVAGEGASPKPAPVPRPERPVRTEPPVQSAFAPPGQPVRAEPPARAVTARPVPAPPVATPRPAGVPRDLQDEILQAGPDHGAATLLSLGRPAAARILADCPGRRRGELLQGIAAIEPGAAAVILPMLLADAAGRAFGGLLPASAASLLAAMPVPEAARILGSTDIRAAADAITELSPSPAAARLAFMPDRRRAAEVLSRTPLPAAIAIAHADREFARRVLPYLTESLQLEVRQAASSTA